MKTGFTGRLHCIVLALFLLAGCQSSDEKVAEYLESAKSLLEAKDYQKAQIQAKNALKINNREVKAYMLLAEIYSQQSKFQPMYGALVQATQIDEKNADAFRQLAKLLLMSGDLEKAQENLDKAVAIEPEHPMAQLVKGMLQSRKGRADEGFETIAAAYRKSPDELELVVAYAGMLLQRKE